MSRALYQLKSQLLRWGRPFVRFLRPAPLDHLEPVSRRWGYERGTAVSRVMIDRFIERHQDAIHGDLIEIKNPRYIDQYGTKIGVRDILDVDTSNPLATIVTDLATADMVESNKYDCFILTETLQFLFDLHAAVGHAYRILKPGGVLLVSVPSKGPSDPELLEYDCWRFTPTSCRLLFGKHFGEENVVVEPYGNFATTFAELSGIAIEELPPEKLELYEPQFSTGVCVRATKPVDAG